MSPSLATAIRLFCLLFLLSVAAEARSQSALPSPFSLGLQAGISYSGWNLALVGQYQIRDFSAYLGPSVSLNRGLPPKGPIGLSAGLNYGIPSQRDWLGSVVNLDYQLHFYHASAGPADRLHEFHLSCGLVFKIGKSFSVVQTLGYGAYLESAYQSATEGRKFFGGYSGLLRLRAGYQF